MECSIREKLDRVHELYPPDRLAASRRRWQWLWQGGERPDRQPFYYQTYKPRYYGTIYDSAEELLHARLDEYITRGRLDDDFIPALFLGCKTSTIPTLFGAREFQVGFAYDCEPILSSIDEVPSLSAPKIAGSAVEGWLAMQRELVELTAGELPVHVIDMQGTADVCGKLLGYEEMLLGALSEPTLFHELMALVTETFITVWQAQRDLLGDLFVPTHLGALSWVPNDRRASLSIDSLAMIGADFYEEFYRPHMERLGEGLGALTIHSCGDPSAVIPAVLETPHVAGFNAAQLSLEATVAAGPPCGQVLVTTAPVAQIESTIAMIEEHDLRLDLALTGIWPMAADGALVDPDRWGPGVWETHARVLDACRW